MLKYVIPVAFGIALLLYLLRSYRKGDVGRRDFGIGLFISLVLIFAPVEYILVEFIAEVFGFYYTYVLVFLISILVLFSVQVYTIKKLSEVDRRTVRIVQEMAIMRAELEEKIEGKYGK